MVLVTTLASRDAATGQTDKIPPLKELIGRDHKRHSSRADCCSLKYKAGNDLEIHRGGYFREAGQRRKWWHTSKAKSHEE